MYCAIKFWKGKKKANTTLISPGTTNKYRFLEEWTKLTRKETILIECLDMTPKAQAAKAKINKWAYIKRKTKRQSTKHKGNLQNRRKYLQIMSQIRG